MKFSGKKKSLVYYPIFKITTALLGIFFWWYFAKILEIDEYGEFGYLLAIGSVGSSIAIFGLDWLVTVSQAKKENIFSAAFLLGLVSSLTVSSVVFLISNNFQLSLYVFGMVLFSLMIAKLLGERKYVLSSLHELLQRFSLIILALILYPYFGIHGIILGYAISTFAGLKTIYSYMKEEKVPLRKLRSKVPFMLESYFVKLSGYIFWWGDKLLIGSLFSFTMVGSFQIASQSILFLTVLPNMLISYFMPQEAQGFANYKLKIWSIVISVLLATIGVLLAPYVIDLLLEKYRDSVLIIQIMISSLPFWTSSSIISAEFIGKEKTRIVLFAEIIQVCLYFSLIILLGTIFGLLGIGIAFLTSVITKSVFFFVLKFNPELIIRKK